MGVKLNPFTGDLQLFNGGGIEWAIQGILDNFSPVNGTNIIPIGSLVDGSASTNYSRVDLQEDNPNSWRVGNKLIVPEGLGGWYLITFALSHPTDPILGSNNQVALGDFRVGIRLNGDTKNQVFSVDAGAGTSEAGSFALPIKLQEADEIEFEFNCSSAVNEDFIIRASVIELGGVATTTQTVEVTSIIEENCLLALSVDQGNINANTTISLQDNISGVTVNNNIIFNNGTSRATLKAGKTYKLQAYCRHAGSVSNTASNFQWYNVTNAKFIGRANQLASLNAPTNDAYQPTASTIITPSTDIEVELRCLAVSAVNQGLRVDATHATIEKISENIINTVTAGATDTKLQRVDNDLFETAQVGVEYFSPIQTGRIYGTVFRQYFTTSLPGDLTAGNTVSKLVDYNIYFTDGNSNRNSSRGFSEGGNGTDLVLIQLFGLSGNNNLSLTGVGGWNITDGWVDYAK